MQKPIPQIWLLLWGLDNTSMVTILPPNIMGKDRQGMTKAYPYQSPHLVPPHLILTLMGPCTEVLPLPILMHLGLHQNCSEKVPLHREWKYTLPV